MQPDKTPVKLNNHATIASSTSFSRILDGRLSSHHRSALPTCRALARTEGLPRAASFTADLLELGQVLRGRGLGRLALRDFGVERGADLLADLYGVCGALEFDLVPRRLHLGAAALVPLLLDMGEVHLHADHGPDQRDERDHCPHHPCLDDEAALAPHVSPPL